MREPVRADEIVRDCGVNPAHAERLATYANLRFGGHQHGEAVRQMGIHRNTGTRYAAWWRSYYGLPKENTSAGSTSEDVRLRLLSKIRIDEASGCWIWQGASTSGGYGVIRFRRTPGERGTYNAPTHRVSYLIHVGPIPEGLVLDHLCRVRLCCNPDHLEPVTNRENILRGVSPSARNAHMTHCDYGHPLAGANLYIKPGRGDRACLVCKRIDDRERIRLRAALPPYTPEERQELAAMLLLKPVRRRRVRRFSTPVDPTVDLDEMRRRHPRDRTHCPVGHPYSGPNLIVRNGTRICRECRNADQKRRYRQAL
jgi:hypothetical protein